MSAPLQEVYDGVRWCGLSTDNELGVCDWEGLVTITRALGVTTFRCGGCGQEQEITR